MQQRERRFASAFRRNATAVLALVTWAAVAGSAGAIDWTGHWWVGGGGAFYTHADKEGGGFRVGGELFGARVEQTVNLSDEFHPGFTLGYGLKRWEGPKRWQNAQLTIELEASRWTSSLGPETAFIDPNASTRVLVPGNSSISPDGDETGRTFSIGDVTLMPVFVNALVHWGSPRADFYTGLGLGVVLAEADEDIEYAEFVADTDKDDLVVDDTLALNVKVGANMRLGQGGRWYFYFEGKFFTSHLLGSGQQVSWPGVEAFFGTRDYDIDGDGTIDEAGVDADFRLIDPGQVRVDGATIGLGFRYRFGSGRQQDGATAGL